MRITKSQLSQIIEEEIESLQEIDFLKRIFSKSKSKDITDVGNDLGDKEGQVAKSLTSPKAGPVSLRHPIDYCRELSRNALDGDAKHPQHAKFIKRCQELSQNRDPDFIARLQGEETAEWEPGMPSGEFQRQHGSLEQFSNPVKALEHVLDMEFEGVAGYKDSAARYDEYISGESSFRRDKGTSIKSGRWADDNISLPGGGYSQQALDQYGAMQEKITKSQLKQIILEELEAVLSEEEIYEVDAVDINEEYCPVCRKAQIEEKKKRKKPCKKAKGKKFVKRVNGRCRSFGQSGKAKGGGPRIRPGTKKGDAYCARSAGIKKCKNPPCANTLSRRKWKCRGKKSMKE